MKLQDMRKELYEKYGKDSYCIVDNCTTFEVFDHCKIRTALYYFGENDLISVKELGYKDHAIAIKIK